MSTPSTIPEAAAAIIEAVQFIRPENNVADTARLVAGWVRFDDSGSVRARRDRVALLAEIQRQDPAAFETVWKCQRRVMAMRQA